MAYELKTIKVELNGSKGIKLFKKGDYVVFYKELLHGTQKAVNLLTRQYLTYPEGQKPKLVIEGEQGEEKMKVEGAKTLDVDLLAVDWDAVNDAIIVGQVKEWSFGPVVDQEAIDGLPGTVRKGIIEEANQLYGKMRPLPKGGDEK